jgi:predicted DNA-binding protein YlxM (UPF0122 family)
LKNIVTRKITIINKALNHYQELDPYFKASADFFKAHYVDGLSIRTISKKFFDTPATTVHRHIKEVEILVKYYIKKHCSHLNLKQD